MKEKFLHFVWRFQLLHGFPLKTTDGVEVEIIKRGIWNKIDSGPDFSMAQIKIGKEIWMGNLEIHVNSSDWNLHGHSKDDAYQNIILHIVYKHDREIESLVSKNIKTLELASYIPKEVLANYEQMVHSERNFIPCEQSLHLIQKETLGFWLDRLMVERLERKTGEIEEEYRAHHKNWECLLFKKLAYAFGLKINADVFTDWANSFDFNVLVKVQQNSDWVHALFFGQAGFLDFQSRDTFVQLLQKEYAFLKRKFNLYPIQATQFKFFRLRPVSFPTVRLMQLAVLYSTYQNLFSFLMGTSSMEKIYKVFEDLEYPEFWENHFTLQKESSVRSTKAISRELVERITINVIIPLKYVYAKHRGVDLFEELTDLLRSLPSEKNTLINRFSERGLKPRNALESQAFLELKKQFCDEKKCLNCALGLQILKNV